MPHKRGAAQAATRLAIAAIKFRNVWIRLDKVRKPKCWPTDKRTKNRQTNRRNYNNFKKLLSYDGDLSSCQVWIWLDKVFSSYSPETEMLMDRQMDKKQPNKQMELHQFRQQLTCDGDEFD